MAGRRSKVRRLDPEVRQTVERMLREDRLTLRDMIAELERKFPDQELPSRSGLHRYQVSLQEMLGRMREIDVAARVVVEELGENADDKAGALLCQSITTLATHAALNAQSNPDVSIEDVRKLARAARDTIAARGQNLKERETIERHARDRLLREQDARLEESVRAQGMTEEQAEFWRKRILGIA